MNWSLNRRFVLSARRFAMPTVDMVSCSIFICSLSTKLLMRLCKSRSRMLKLRCCPSSISSGVSALVLVCRESVAVCAIDVKSPSSSTNGCEYLMLDACAFDISSVITLTSISIDMDARSHFIWKDIFVLLPRVHRWCIKTKLEPAKVQSHRHGTSAS